MVYSLGLFLKEYFTEAIVLGVRGRGYDKWIDLYTRSLGRIEARVVSGRRITSKLSPHFKLGNRVQARLVYKNQFTVTDVLEVEVFSCEAGGYTGLLNLFFLLRSLSPVAEVDLNLWYWLSESVKNGRVDFEVFLKILGYSGAFSSCVVCGKRRVSYFFVADQSFLCDGCSVKFPEGQLIRI